MLKNRILQPLQLRIKVAPHTDQSVCIKYIFKKRFNFFNGWKTLCYTHDGAYLDRYQPVLFWEQKEAIEYATKLSQNPQLIIDHNNFQDSEYLRLEAKRMERLSSHYKEVEIK